MDKNTLSEFGWIAIILIIISVIIAGIPALNAVINTGTDHYVSTYFKPDDGGNDEDTDRPSVHLEKPLLAMQLDTLVITKVSSETKQYEISVDGTVVATIDASGDSTNYDLSFLTKGYTYVISVVAKATGKIDSNPAEIPYSPELALTLEPPTLTIEDDNLVITKGSPETDFYEVFIDGESQGVIPAEDVTNYDLSSLPDGTHTIGVVAKADDAKDSSEVTTTYVATTPVVLEAPTLDVVVEGSKLIITKVSPETEKYEIFINGASVGIVAASGSTTEYDLSSLEEGEYTIEVVAMATGAVNSEAAQIAYLFALPTLNPPTLAIDDKTLVITKGSPETDFYEIIINGESQGVVPAEDVTNYDLSSLPDGTYTIDVVAKADDAHDSSKATTTYKAVSPVVLEAPTLAIDGNTLVITKVSPETEKYEIFIDGTSVGTVAASDVTNYDLFELVAGTYNIEVIAKATGAVDSSKTGISFTRYYTDEEIEASDYLYAIGKTDPSYVVAVFNEDYSEVTIVKNGEDSDGLMKGFDVPWSSGDKDEKSPMYNNQATLTSAVIQDGVTSISGTAFEYCSMLESIKISDSVTEIGSNAFVRCKNLKTANLPNAITNIPYCLFAECYSLEGIAIPESVSQIGAYAFLNCRSIESVVIPNGVIGIESGAFSGCTGLTNITIPDGVTIIGDSAFYACESLTNITIPDNVTIIGDSAFYACKSLTNITIPDNVTIIGDSVFSGCTNLTSITIPSGVTSIGDSVFSGCTNLTSITIPDSVTSIGDSAFYACESLTSITIPDSVTSIGKNAFRVCNNITNIIIHDNITNIGLYAFTDCIKLVSITVDSENDYYSSDENGVLFNKEKTTLIQYPAGNTAHTYIIPGGVTSIGASAFSRCASLKSIEIPDSVTSIDADAFYHCDNLTSITIPDGVTSIADGTFCWSGLENITIPNTVTNIGDSAFSFSGIRSITIHSGVTNIGSSAFYCCGSLTNIIVDNENGYYSNDEYGVLFDKNKTTLMQYPSGNEATSYTIPDGVIEITGGAFGYHRKNLTTITIPDTVTKIGGMLFWPSNSITAINYTGTVDKWSSISFTDKWDSNTGEYTIYCADGTIAKDGTITKY